MTYVALTIAGSDPSGGAGIQADLKTFHQLGVYGMSVLTLLTVQNTRRLDAVEVLSADFVGAQLDAVLEDIPPQAAKTGALGSSEVIRAIAERAGSFSFPLVVDPVMISKHGAPLISPGAQSALEELLLPRAFLVTPNLRGPVASPGLSCCPAHCPARNPGRSGQGGTPSRRGGRRALMPGIDPALHRPAHRDQAHARNRLHLLRGHNRAARQRARPSGCRRGRQAVYHPGDRRKPGPGKRLRAGESSRPNRTDILTHSQGKTCHELHELHELFFGSLLCHRGA